MEKREFLKSSSAAVVLASLGISLTSCAEDDPKPDNNVPSVPTTGGDSAITLSLSDFPALAEDDGWALDNSDNLLLVNIDGNIRAFSSFCPHSGCTDQWDYAGSVFICNCHGSQFNSDGSLRSGPATSGLLELPVEVDGDTLTIGG